MFSDIFQYSVLTIYAVALVLVVMYSLGQLHLLVIFLRKRRKVKGLSPLASNDEHPFVTIQLPMYNEKYVVERLLDSIAAIDYPYDRFEVQVLDDSTDDSIEVTARKIEELRAMGIDIEHVRRPIREGFKAGALAYGMDFAKGEFLAIFDADFLPNPDFLKKAMPHFLHDRIGVVQTRWEHLNKDYSMFTEVQAFQLDAHFTIEQFSRYYGGFYINFNGTAGIWRKQTIVDAGGWHSDTLTEDLDLSYRAQIKGWEMRYVDEIGSPAELPAEMGAIKSQQYRWMKGGAEVARKMLNTLWHSDAPLIRKIHGSVHLLSSSVFMLVLVLGAISVPLLYLRYELMSPMAVLAVNVLAGILQVSFYIFALMYLVTMFQRESSTENSLTRFLKNYIPFLSLSMGMSWHNSIAVLQGYMGKRTDFVRTPKMALKKKGDKWQNNSYLSKKVHKSVYIELMLALYFAFGIGLAVHYKAYNILPFFILEMVGFAVIGYYSVRHAKQLK